MPIAPRVVIVHRRTELETLIDTHGTRGQAEFFLKTRGRTLADAQERHDRQMDALADVRAAIPPDWRRGEAEREDLPRFGFEPEDVCIAVGQDGLVANLAKYVDAQPVIGINADPARNPGVLVRHNSAATPGLLTAMEQGRLRLTARAMVRATLDDGQSLDALNEMYVGNAAQQSARYRLSVPGAPNAESQSSSGLIAATGTGATGWAASIARDRNAVALLPAADERALAWFVREAWPSPGTGTTLTHGRVEGRDELTVVVESDALVVFGDGLEADHLTATWGQQIQIAIARRELQLVY